MVKKLILPLLASALGSLLAMEVCWGGSLADAVAVGGPLNGEALRQELVKELAKAKAVIETGTSPDELAANEKNIRAASELIQDQLSDQQKNLSASAISALHETRLAWLVTLDSCHHAVEQNALAQSAVILGAHSGGCSDGELASVFAELGILATFGRFYDPNFAFSLMPGYRGPPNRLLEKGCCGFCAL